MVDFSKITDWESLTEERVRMAVEYFRSGYNCAQAVTLAFADWYDISPILMSRFSASFGGGIGRMRETCGAACGLFMLAGLHLPRPHDINPYPDAAAKKRNYENVQLLASRFREVTGSLLCRELLGAASQSASTSPAPEERTPQYYAKRPCSFMVETAVRVFMQWVRENN